MRMSSRIIALAAGWILLWAGAAHAAQSTDGDSLVYYRAKVTAIDQDQGTLSARYLNGPNADKLVTAQTAGLNSYSDITLPTYKVGDTVIVSTSTLSTGTAEVAVVDQYRLPFGLIILAVVIGLAILFAGWRGIGAVMGLLISLSVISVYTIPQLLDGHSPYVVAFVSCFVIALFGIYLAHGFSRRTTIALISTFLTLFLAAAASSLAVVIDHLNGIGSEDISYLHQQLPNVNLQGVLFAGIMIGVLGVLDDITVGQAAAVDELLKANPKLSWQQLYKRALSVGREHIASLINTLVLAYVGTSFVFIMYAAAMQNLPIWLTLNSEIVSEEIVRSLLGSIALILAVPLATLLSAYFLAHPVGLSSIRERRMKSQARQAGN